MAGILSLDVETDRPGERLTVHRVGRLPGVEFWTVRDSMRHWAMHHDTFTASLVASRPSMNATWSYRGRKHDISTGEMQLMEPGEVHTTTHVSEPASFFVIWWHPDVLMQASESLGLSGAVHLKVSQTDHPGLQASFRGLLAGVQHAQDPAFVEEQFLDSTLQLLELCGERKPPSRPPGSHPAMTRVRARLHDEFAESLSLERLAKEVGLSKFHVARCFKEATGVAPHQYQKLLRLQSARRHIERGACVREAAAAAGFADEAHLSRSFRDWLGVSPGVWRRANAHKITTSIPALAT
ncbi:MAG TPA: AraC family transcriptional regulator [Polyangiaceae bacterium]|jgi:AraC-like DNA-binding protein